MLTVAAVVYWARTALRQRWRAHLALALLIALAGATVMAAVAGARRGSSSVERLQARTLPATALVLPSQPGFDWDVVRQLPGVAALATFFVTPLQFEGEPLSRVVGEDILVPGDDQLLATVERPAVLEGRLPDPRRHDEVVVTPGFRRERGKGVGDTITLGLLSPAQLDAFFRDNVVPSTTEGPTIEATIVGVVRSVLINEDQADDPGYAVASAGLFAAFPDNLLGSERRGILNAFVRLRDGEAGLPAFDASLAEATGSADIAVFDAAEEARRRTDVARFEARALLVFASVAAIATALLVGQTVVRTVSPKVGDVEALDALGMTGPQVRAALAVGPVVAAVIGGALAVAGAVAASGGFPVGTAARAEPDPGVSVDAAVMVAGMVSIPTLVAACAAATAGLALRGAPGAIAGRSRSLTTAVVRAGLPPAAVIGVKFALDPGRGRDAVPVRPALLGSVTGVAGVLAALTFSAGVDDAVARPERFGRTHHLEALVGFDGADFGPVTDILTLVAGDSDVVAVNDTRNAVGRVGDVPVEVFTLDPVGEPFDVVVSRGRRPDGPGDIAVAPRTAEALGVGVGDSITIAGTRGGRDMTVTGIAFVPALFHNDFATGAWVTGETYDDLFEGFAVRMGLVELQAGADAEGVAARLQAATDGALELAPPVNPVERDELQSVAGLPAFLAAFLALLALGALGHALATAVRRRRHDLAVLRALGMSRSQAQGVAFTHATTVALLGVVVGVPMGLALGRVVWRTVAEATPVAHVAPVHWVALILVVPAALVAANVLAIWPARRAASLRPSEVLRAE